MKIAVCYRGHLRTLTKTFENHKEMLFGDHEIDFFLHTWQTSITEELQFAKKLTPGKILVDSYRQFQMNPYGSIHYDIDTTYQKNDRSTKISSQGLHCRPFNCLSMLYSLHQSNMLCKQFSQEKNIKYDLVVSLRPDIFFLSKVDLGEVNPDLINITWYERKGDMLQADSAIIDHIAISSPDNMNLYSDCFLYVPFYYFVERKPFVPECLLGRNVSFHEMSVNMLESTHSVIRTNNYAPGIDE